MPLGSFVYHSQASRWCRAPYRDSRRTGGSPRPNFPEALLVLAGRAGELSFLPQAQLTGSLC